MKFPRLTLLATALAWTVGAGAQSPEGTPAVPSTTRNVPPPVSAKVKSRPVTSAAAAVREDSPGSVVFHILLGEIALQRGDSDLALAAYRDLAARTDDPHVLERAIEVAGYSRRLDVALELAQRWVALEPESSEARQMLAGVLIMENRLDQLGPHLAELLARDKENLTANLLRLHRMFARSTDKAAVLAVVEEVTTPYLGIAEAHYARAIAAADAGQQEKAQQEIGRALELRPDWSVAALTEAQILATAGSVAKAIERLERFLDGNQDATDVRMHLARLYITDKQYDRARKQFEILLDKNPDNPEIIYPVAILALQQNDNETAQKLLQRLLASDFAQPSTAHFYLGQIAEEGKRPEMALEEYAQVGLGDYYVAAQVRRAVILSAQGKLDDGQTLLKDAAARYEPGKIAFVVAQAQLLREAKRNDEAFALLQNAIKEQPDRPELLYDTALLAEKIGRFDVLETYLRRVIALQPDNAHAYNALGYTFADQGIRLDEAQTLIAKALELAPQDPFIMDSMGWVYYRRGDMENAEKYLSDAYKLRPDAEIAAHLGEVLWVRDRRDEARNVWREALEKAPQNEMLLGVQKKFAP